MAINSEQIDLARSLLYAFINVEDDQSAISPVHFNRVSNKANFFSFDDDFLEHLKVLELIGEAKQVKPNFWSITPTRSVKFEDKWMIISSLNNTLLKELIVLRDSNTLARFSDFYLEEHPRQNLFSWMGVPGSLSKWALDLKSAAKSDGNLKSSTQNPMELKYYAPWLKSRDGEWVEFNEAKKTDDKMLLAKTKDISPDYFWFKLDQSGNYQSYFDKSHLIETMLGLRMNAGCREWKINMTALENGTFKLTWPKLLRTSLEKLITVTSISRANNLESIEYILCKEHIDLIATNLTRFGLTFRKI